MDITIAQAAIEPSLTLDDPAPGAAPAPVDPGAAAKFSDLMDASEPPGPEEVGAVQSVDPSASASASPRTLGDNILNGLNHVATDLQGTWRNVQASLSARAGVGFQELLRTQLAVSTMGMQYELVTKAVSRSTQNLEQLVKLQ